MTDILDQAFFEAAANDPIVEISGRMAKSAQAINERLGHEALLDVSDSRDHSVGISLMLREPESDDNQLQADDWRFIDSWSVCERDFATPFIASYNPPPHQILEAAEDDATSRILVFNGRAKGQAVTEALGIFVTANAALDFIGREVQKAIPSQIVYKARMATSAATSRPENS